MKKKKVTGLSKIQAAALPLKEYLTVKEARIYLGRSRNYVSQQAKRCGIGKTNNGYYKRSDLDKIASGEAATGLQELAANLIIKKGRRTVVPKREKYWYEKREVIEYMNQKFD